MILFNRFTVENYKNVRHADVTLKSINILIGKPGTGKTNLLEAAAMTGLRFLYPVPSGWHRMIRFREPADWFPDLNPHKPVKIQLSKGVLARTLSVNYNADDRTGSLDLSIWDKFDDIKTTLFISNFKGNSFKVNPGKLLENDELCPVRPYCFDTDHLRSHILFPDQFLEPPFGTNLAQLIEPEGPLGEVFENMLGNTGYRRVYEYGSGKIRLGRSYDLEHQYGSIPFESISESWQRFFFLFAAMATNKGAFLLFDNPLMGVHASHAELLARQMLENDQNQYLFSSQNPIIIRTIASQTSDLNLIVCKKGADPYTAYPESVSEEKIKKWLDSGSDRLDVLEN